MSSRRCWFGLIGRTALTRICVLQPGHIVIGSASLRIGVQARQVTRSRFGEHLWAFSRRLRTMQSERLQQLLNEGRRTMASPVISVNATSAS